MCPAGNGCRLTVCGWSSGGVGVLVSSATSESCECTTPLGSAVVPEV